jgi:hypothetical protein
MEMSGHLRKNRGIWWTCVVTCEQSAWVGGRFWLLGNKAWWTRVVTCEKKKARWWWTGLVTQEQSAWLDGRVWLLGNKACYLMDMYGYSRKKALCWKDGSGYLRTKRLARWVCLVTWEQASYLMDMSGYLRTKRVAKWACLFTWEQSVLFDGHLWLPANKARV